MGNQNGRITHRPLQEEANGEGNKLVVGNDSPLYGAMAVVAKVSPETTSKNGISQVSIQKDDDNDKVVAKPVQVHQEGKVDQNQLVVPETRTPTVYMKGATPNAPVKVVACRVISIMFVAILLTVSTCLLIIVEFEPPSISSESGLVQGSTVVLLKEINPFWFETLTIIKPFDSVDYDVQIAVVDCGNVVYDNETISSSLYNGSPSNQDGYHQLNHIETYAYLVEGSWMVMDINITHSPSVKGKKASLLRFTDYKEYQKLQDRKTAPTAVSDEVILLNSTLGYGLNRIYINISSTGFQFFGIQAPAGLQYTYNVTVYKVYINGSSVHYLCTDMNSDYRASCEITFNNTKSLKSKVCIIGDCEVDESSSKLFYELDVYVSRRYMNWVVATLIGFVVSFFIIFIAIGTYDCVRKKIYPASKKAIATPFNRRRTRPPA